MEMASSISLTTFSSFDIFFADCVLFLLFAPQPLYDEQIVLKFALFVYVELKIDGKHAAENIEHFYDCHVYAIIVPLAVSAYDRTYDQIEKQNYHGYHEHFFIIDAEIRLTAQSVTDKAMTAKICNTVNKSVHHYRKRIAAYGGRARTAVNYHKIERSVAVKAGRSVKSHCDRAKSENLDGDMLQGITRDPAEKGFYETLFKQHHYRADSQRKNHEVHERGVKGIIPGRYGKSKRIYAQNGQGQSYPKFISPFKPPDKQNLRKDKLRQKNEPRPKQSADFVHL